MEADLRKRIGQAQEISEQARSTLRDFSSQKQQLEDFISQMTEWLRNVEDSLSAPPQGSNPEHICRVKVSRPCPHSIYQPMADSLLCHAHSAADQQYIR